MYSAPHQVPPGSRAPARLSILAEPPFELSDGWRRSRLSFDEVALAFGESVDLIESAWPDAANSVLSLTALFPLEPGPDGALRSASEPSLRDVVAASIHPTRPQDLAESLVHEARHQEFYGRFGGDPDFGTASIALHHPWKEGERPLASVFLAYHAFIAVAELHLRVAFDPTRALALASECYGRGLETVRQCQQCSAALGSQEVVLNAKGVYLREELDEAVHAFSGLAGISVDPSR